MSYSKAITPPSGVAKNMGGSLMKVEEVLQSSKTECHGRWRRGRLELSLETSARAGGVDQGKW